MPQSTSWNEITGKPTTFPPKAHTHEDIDTWDNLSNKPTSFKPDSHAVNHESGGEDMVHIKFEDILLGNQPLTFDFNDWNYSIYFKPGEGLVVRIQGIGGTKELVVNPERVHMQASNVDQSKATYVVLTESRVNIGALGNGTDIIIDGKMGFNGHSAVNKCSAIANATSETDAVTKLNTLLAYLRSRGDITT